MQLADATAGLWASIEFNPKRKTEASGVDYVNQNEIIQLEASMMMNQFRCLRAL